MKYNIIRKNNQFKNNIILLTINKLIILIFFIIFKNICYFIIK